MSFRPALPSPVPAPMRHGLWRMWLWGPLGTSLNEKESWRDQKGYVPETVDDCVIFLQRRGGVDLKGAGTVLPVSLPSFADTALGSKAQDSPVTHPGDSSCACFTFSGSRYQNRTKRELLAAAGTWAGRTADSRGPALFPSSAFFLLHFLKGPEARNQRAPWPRPENNDRSVCNVCRILISKISFWNYVCNTYYVLVALPGTGHRVVSKIDPVY